MKGKYSTMLIVAYLVFTWVVAEYVLRRTHMPGFLMIYIVWIAVHGPLLVAGMVQNRKSLSSQLIKDELTKIHLSYIFVIIIFFTIISLFIGLSASIDVLFTK